MLLLSLVLACGPNTLPTDSAPPALDVDIAQNGTVTAGASAALTVAVTLPGGDGNLRLFTSSQRGPGPCVGAACLELVGPRRISTKPAKDGVSFALVPIPAGAAPGDTLYVQAAVVQGASVAVSAVVALVVGRTQPGCVSPFSSDFDPTATDDDGSCECPIFADIRSQADADALAGCDTLGGVYVYDYAGATLSLSHLVRASSLSLDGAGLTELHAPALRRVSLLQLSTPDLSIVDLQALAYVDELTVNGIAGTLPPLSAAHARLFGALPPRVVLGGVDSLEVRGTSGMGELAVGVRRGGSVAVVGADGLGELRLGTPSSLAEVEVLDVPDLVTLDLSGIDRIDRLTLDAAPALDPVLLPHISTDLSLTGLGVSSIVAPGDLRFERLRVADNVALANLELPASVPGRWVAVFTDNPNLCVTAIPLVQAPGARVTGTGNLCDP